VHGFDTIAVWKRLIRPNRTFGAVGWLGLGCVAETKAELERVGPGYQNHPDVLELRWLICAEEQEWHQGLQIARALLHHAPDRSSGWLHQAYALRRVPDGGVKQAWKALLPAFDKFPGEPIISFNLSCYACQMQQLDAARVWLKRAVVLARNKGKIKKMALADKDLEALWPEVAEFERAAPNDIATSSFFLLAGLHAAADGTAARNFAVVMPPSRSDRSPRHGTNPAARAASTGSNRSAKFSAQSSKANEN
jgi:hypothetical protein